MTEATQPIEANWEITTERYIVFLDIMGFKNMVNMHEHDFVLDKLEKIAALKSAVEIILSKTEGTQLLLKMKIFSDSIIIISKDGTLRSLDQIVKTSNLMMGFAFHHGIPLKGAMSYGKLTADEEKSIFFGMPLISAYQLQDELLLYGVVLDGPAEKQIRTESPVFFEKYFQLYKTPIKIAGNVSHCLLKWPLSYGRGITNPIPIPDAFQAFYDTSHGAVRRYVDNTSNFIESLKPIDEQSVKK